MYQILVDRFYNGNPAGDALDGEYYYVDGPTKHVENWAHCPQGISVREFYGGDLEGVRQKLDYLQELGIEPTQKNLDILEAYLTDSPYVEQSEESFKLLHEAMKQMC